MANEKILIVDDDEDIRDSVTHILTKEEMLVTATEEGDQVIAILKKEPFDLVLLDLMLKDYEGFEILKQVRKIWSHLPVLILTCRQEEEKKAIGFELEADDFLTKPFSRVELVARIKRHIRRYRGYAGLITDDEKLICCGDLKLNLKTCILYKKNEEISLTAKLFRILKFFMENPSQVFSKEQIYNHCWDDGYYDDNTVKVYIRKLRKSIEDDPGNPCYIKTAIGFGYRFDG